MAWVHVYRFNVLPYPLPRSLFQSCSSEPTRKCDSFNTKKRGANFPKTRRNERMHRCANNCNPDRMQGPQVCAEFAACNRMLLLLRHEDCRAHKLFAS